MVGLLACCQAWGEEENGLATPWSRQSFSAEEGCEWQPAYPGLVQLRFNAHYLAPPGPEEEWAVWLERLRAYREWLRAHLGDASQWVIALRFDGVRAWVRAGRPWAFAADLQPGEPLAIEGEARWIEGNGTLCLAFDWCDRGRGSAGSWQGWSTVVASAPIPKDGDWHKFRIEAQVPSFDPARHWARPILGMDGTFDPTQGSVSLRHLRLKVPWTQERAQRWAALLPEVARPAGFDDSIYQRADLRWMARNFVCGFLFVYDRAFWDPEAGRYCVAELCEEAQREFGGFDSVVLWHAYPRLGADERNQFDFFRHLPGGLDGLRQAARDFHRHGVKVFLPYNPWDVGTRREGRTDEEALAEMVAAIEADGLFLDTLVAAPTRLREAVDAQRPGVAFEPEGHPAIQEMEQCSGSWAQWLQPFPGIGVLHLKWLEPRHIQHQVRRWDRSHQDELAAAWLNGSGILVWENIFGTWNPWNAEDRAALRRMAPVLRFFASLFVDGEWLPCFPTRTPNVFASGWKEEGVRLWTLVNGSGQAVETPVLEVEDEGERFFDLWQGAPLAPQRVDGKVRLAVPLGRFGAIAALRPTRLSAAFSELLERQQQEAQRPVSVEDDPHVAAQPVVEPKPPPPTPATATAAGMLRVEGGTQEFVVRHTRRECGCYPDPGTPLEEWARFLRGYPHDEMMEHRVTLTLPPYWIDPQPVTNGEFEAFVRATGYEPRWPDRFLHHWGGPTCPPERKDQPVVYVDLDDARAYAAWAGKRLPTEWEWHRAAEQHGPAFQRGEVWEWTESERDDGHTRFVLLRGGSRYRAEGSIWYFPGGEQPLATHAKFLQLYPGLDRCSTIGFRCVVPAGA